MNLYLVPASQENIEKSILREVDISVASRHLVDHQFRTLKDLLRGRTGFNCWAMTESKRSIYAAMKAGDHVLLSPKGTGRFKYGGKVFYKVESEGLGKELWPFVPGKPWKLIYFLDNIYKVDIGKKKLITALGYDPAFDVPGTTLVRRKSVASVILDYGSIDQFLASLAGDIPRRTINYHSENELASHARNQTPTVYERPNWLPSLIRDIEALQADPNHKERAHESLVESFFQLLGYTAYDEIKHRQGRIDISIKDNNLVKFVIEVKKDWGLSREDKKVVNQAYGYACEIGGLWAVITNGNYYAFYDRTIGFSYEENFSREFRLTQLSCEDIEFIDKLRKSS